MLTVTKSMKEEMDKINKYKDPIFDVIMKVFEETGDDNYSYANVALMRCIMILLHVSNDEAYVDRYITDVEENLRNRVMDSKRFTESLKEDFMKELIPKIH